MHTSSTVVVVAISVSIATSTTTVSISSVAIDSVIVFSSSIAFSTVIISIAVASDISQRRPEVRQVRRASEVPRPCGASGLWPWPIPEPLASGPGMRPVLIISINILKCYSYCHSY